jgi:AcrR family transcriptional regulator
VKQAFQCQNNAVTTRVPEQSARKAELLEAAYRYVLENGLGEMSLRPLAGAIGSSPRVLLFLFGSKEGLVRALLARARTDELRLLEEAKQGGQAGLGPTIRAVWGWLIADAHRPLLTLWLEAYARSLAEPEGPWSGFARQTVEDWLGVLGEAQAPGRRRTKASAVERTLGLAVLRGGLLDLLATGDTARASGAVERYLDLNASSP